MANEQSKKAKISFVADSPMQITDETEQDDLGLGDEQKSIVHQVGKTIKAYRIAAEELLKGKYAHIKDSAPIYLADPGKALVVSCQDGVVIRFERKTDGTRLMSGWMNNTLPEVAAFLSQNLIQCYPDRNYKSTISTTGMDLKLFSENPITKQTTDVVSAKIGFDVVIEHPEKLPRPPQKPFCLLSVRNTLEFQIHGVLFNESEDARTGKHFLARTAYRLPVGWDCIEIYPFIDLEHWKPEYAPIWAENDLLAAVLAGQVQEAHFESLDPNAGARNQLAKLLNDYKDLLESNPEREEILQTFLRDHSVLLCPTQTKAWPKLALGAQKTDFVFKDATGEYLLVELERSALSLFLMDGHPSRELNHARGQIVDWKRYLEDNLSTAQRELGLAEISVNPKSLIVIGRSQSLTSENRRKLVAMENESPKLKIMTYDDIYENAKAVVENLLGPIWETPGETRIYYLPNQ